MAKATISKGVKTKTTWANALKRDWQLYLLLMIPVALVVIFNYASDVPSNHWYGKRILNECRYYPEWYSIFD